jgi:anti-anti-sigma factor
MTGAALPELESIPPKPEIVVSRLAGATVVRLRGEHDLQTAEGVAQTLEPLLEADAVVVVDLTPTSFMDSSILRVLLTVEEKAGKSQTRFGLAIGTNPLVRSVLELTDLLEYFIWAATPEEVCSRLAAPRKTV